MEYREDLRELRRRIDAIEQQLAEMRGLCKAIAILTPMLFTILNLLLRILRIA